jgi:hypothetical protein
MLVAMLRHPFGAREVALERLPCAMRFTFGVDVAGDFAPIATF